MYKGSNFKSEVEFNCNFNTLQSLYSMCLLHFSIRKKDPLYLNTEPNSTLLLQ